MTALGVRRYGTSGPVVVFIHGWCCSGDFWRHQVAAFADECRLVVLDLGHADPVVDDDLSIEATGAAVAAVIETEGITECTLVGHSLGGPITIETAVRLGDRCRLVVGVDSFTDAAFYARLPDAEIAARLAPFQRDFAGAMANMVEQITLIGGADLRGWIIQMMASASPESALASMASLLDHDLEAVWPCVGCPIRAINSEPLDRPDSRLALAGLEMILMPEVGHFPMLEAPEAFNRHLSRVLNIGAA
ncbi:MAG: Arylesterase [Proteobacteria bacterium]|nr:Arylesterase [Pseudomonadota bacterium]